ncbi:uncharacterized protein K02A2.6-like [Armigeres subalbatus]|uniref:uncharacterized protein K02A2.6-like n=1 Tax=Armigeres subalbatus TaxID=124917 RepID=UPI002ED4E11D
MLTSDYDNGATGRRAESPEKFIKIIKRKAATKIAEELSKVKAELEKTRMEKDELSRILATKGQEDNEFAQARSSTIREEHSANETLLMTMNNMSLGSLNIPECVPATGESELSKRDYDHWKNVLNASLNLIQAVDEPPHNATCRTSENSHTRMQLLDSMLISAQGLTCCRRELTVPGELNMADALSRLVTESQATESFDESHEKHLLYYLDTGSMEFTWDDIETEAERDAEQILIRESIRTNCWEKNLKRYESEAKNLRVLGALVFKNDRVVLPYALRERAMSSAHQGHMGASSMKKILRNCFWWPCMSKHVETFVMGCETCFRLSKKNPPVPLTSCDLPDGPWGIMQVDFFSFKDCGSGEFLVVVDVYSRYLHVVEMKQIDADSTNAALSRIFEVWGYPIAIHSDNGPPFQGEKFIKTWENRGVKIRKAIPLSAQSNGAVERQNKGLKDTLAAAKIDKVNWKMALEQYLHMHNKVRPLSRLGVTPFELLVGWRFRGTFPFLWEALPADHLDRTDIREKDAKSKMDSKQYADLIRGARESNISVGDRVLLAQSTKQKGDPTFSEDRYTVITRDGAKIVVQSDRGVQYSKNIQDVKKVPINLRENRNMETSDLDENSAEVEPPIYLQEDELPIEKPKRTRKKPSRFDDMVLFCVFD